MSETTGLRVVPGVPRSCAILAEVAHEEAEAAEAESAEVVCRPLG